jgi:hypothetical protein
MQVCVLQQASVWALAMQVCEPWLLQLAADLSANASSQLHVLEHDGHAFSVDSTEVRVLKEGHKVGLACLLHGQESVGLEAKIRHEVVSDLPHQALEWDPAYMPQGVTFRKYYLWVN